jgi:hypothetical protein
MPQLILTINVALMAVEKKKKKHHSFYQGYPNNTKNRCSGYSALEVESGYCVKQKRRPDSGLNPEPSRHIPDALTTELSGLTRQVSLTC